MQFIEAANYTAGRPNGPPLGIVIHDEEFPEGTNSAEAVANFFHNQPKNPSSDSSVPNPPGTGGSSAHYTHDSDSTVQCVRDGDTAWDAPPNTGWPHIGMEHDGFAKQTRAEWLDKHGKAMLRRSAKRAAKLSAKYGIPVRRLTVAELQAHKKGFAGHVDVSKAFGMSSHSDPGTGFPWDWYLERVRRYRWVYVHYVATNAAGKVLAKSKVVRASNEAAAKFITNNAGKLGRALKDGAAKVRQRRVW